MRLRFWVRRFAVVYAVAFVLIAGVQRLKTGNASFAVEHGIFWAAATAGVFTCARLCQARLGSHCAICKDTPEIAGIPRGKGN
jgi:hypothetical protein